MTASVMALAIVMLALWAAVASLAPPVRSAGLVLAPVLARWSVVPVSLLFRPARPRGLGHALHTAAWPLAAPLSTVISATVALALFGLPGLMLLAIAAVAAVIVAQSASRILDGITGDTYGAAIEVSQVAVLLAIIAAGSRGWIEPTFVT